MFRREYRANYMHIQRLAGTVGNYQAWLRMQPWRVRHPHAHRFMVKVRNLTLLVAALGATVFTQTNQFGTQRTAVYAAANETFGTLGNFLCDRGTASMIIDSSAFIKDVGHPGPKSCEVLVNVVAENRARAKEKKAVTVAERPTMVGKDFNERVAKRRSTGARFDETALAISPQKETTAAFPKNAEKTGKKRKVKSASKSREQHRTAQTAERPRTVRQGKRFGSPPSWEAAVFAR
jgi:hypothetical protein